MKEKEASGRSVDPGAREVHGSPELTGGLVSAVISLMPDAAVVVNSDGTIVAANTRAETMFGYSLGTLQDRPIEALVPERVRKRHRVHRSSYAHNLQARPMGAGLELSGRRLDGSEFPVDISLAPLADGGDGLVVAAIRDMTEQQAASAAQAELATIVSSSLDAIISTTREGQVTNWNPAAEALLGYGAAEMLGEHVTKVVPPEGQGVFEELLDSAFTLQTAEARDTEWITKDAEPVPVAVSASPLQTEGGRIRGFSFIVRDIRQRKAAEEELRRLLVEERRLERQHAAAAEIRLALLSGQGLDGALTLISERAAELIGAKMVSVLERSNGPARIVAGAGIPEVMLGMEFPEGGTLADAVIDEERVITAMHRQEVSHAEIPAEAQNGPVLGVPVVTRERVEAALTMVRAEGEKMFTQGEQLFAESLAAQAALAIELDRAKRDRENMMLISDRERIGRDLHDHVIQRLFAAGLGLQASFSLVQVPEVRERLAEAVEALDETIRQIRNTIFELSSPPAGTSLLRVRAVEMTKEIEGALGFAPTLRFSGPVDSAVSERIMPHVLAVLREGLSNAARHSGAGRVEVLLEATEGWFAVTVSDDGVGIPAGVSQSGLANLAERARLLGGGFEAEPRQAGGTRLEWRVPLEA